MPDATYPLPAFYYRVEFNGQTNSDTSFAEVSGLRSEMDLEPHQEGGENSFVYQLPKGVKHPNLVLKRGVGGTYSPLVKWCMKTLHLGFPADIETKLVDVKLLNKEGTPVRHWTLADAFPVKWEVDGFKSTKNEVAIETIELAYTTITREL
jgi:phage tail-like protein